MHQENEDEDAYLEVDFTSLQLETLNDNIDEPQPPFFDEIYVPLTKSEEETMFFGIQVPNNRPPNENLLDLAIDSPEEFFKNIVRPREFVNNRELEITGPITIQDGYITSYKLYKIKTYKKHGDEQESLVERRYSDFEYLHSELIEKYGGFLIPKLPEKNMWTTLNMEANSFIGFRKEELKKYLHKLLNHTKLKYTDEVQSFLFEGQEFSQRKGHSCSQHKIEDTVIKLTSNALETGLDILKRIINKEPEANPMKPIHINSLKEQEIAQYQIIVNSMSDTIRELQPIVFNTIEESNIFTEFASICHQMLHEEGESRSITILDYSGNVRIQKIETGSMASEWTREGTNSQELSPEVDFRCEHLIESYENVFEFIEICKEALKRRSELYDELESLKQQYFSQEQKFTLNPRSINMDILKSRMNQTQIKLEKFTDDLLIELEMQVSMNKSMISSFVKNLEETRHGLYSKCV